MCVPDSRNPLDRIAQRLIEKRYNANFNQAWSTIAIKEWVKNFTITSKLVSKPIFKGIETSTLAFQQFHN
jgi:hypothetical protein